MSFPEKKFKIAFRKDFNIHASVGECWSARWGYALRDKEIKQSGGFKSLIKEAEDYARLESKPLLALEFKRGFESAQTEFKALLAEQRKRLESEPNGYALNACRDLLSVLEEEVFWRRV